MVVIVVADVISGVGVAAVPDVVSGVVKGFPVAKFSVDTLAKTLVAFAFKTI